LLLKLAPAVGGLEPARNLSYEEMLVISATVEYGETIAALRDRVEALYANPPMDPEHDQGKSEMEWADNLAEVEQALATEMDCWHFPLDHPRGERFLGGDR
jgi:hypothetical protein